MNCERLTTDDLVTWLDGEADAALAARVADVGACAVCRDEADLLRRTGDLLAGVPAVWPSPRPSAELEARIGAARGAATPAAPVRLRLLRPRVAVAAAAALVIAVAAWKVMTPEEEELLTAREEEALAEDLAVISNLDALQAAELSDLAELAEDLDVLESLGLDEEGG